MLQRASMQRQTLHCMRQVAVWLPDVHTASRVRRSLQTGQNDDCAEVGIALLKAVRVLQVPRVGQDYVRLRARELPAA